MKIWDFSDIENNSFSTECVKQLICNSAEELSNYTKNQISIEFDELEIIPGSISIMAKTISESFVGNKNVLSYQNSGELEDANKLYKGIDYGYEIHNKQYKYRVFDIRIMPVFPVTVRLDEDILEDEKNRFSEYALIINDSGLIDIYNENDFLAFLKIVLNSCKVKTILKRMLNSNSESN